MRIAKEKNLVDNPDARKLQTEPVPVMGGIAVFFGVVSAVLVGCILTDCMPLLPVLMAMVVLLYMGAMDDLVGFSQLSRVLAEVLVLVGMIYASGKCVDSLHGLWGLETFSWWIAVPLTVFAGVGIINAINMIDGVNGLSSGLCMTCAGLFGGVFLRRGNVPNAMLAFAMCASLLPFFLHNVYGKRSRMFIGDAGTMMMGVLMSWCIICLLSGDASRYDGGEGTIALALAILSVPVFDTLRVMTQRMVHGISPFKADKTHLHHAFIAVGISHSVTALSEIAIDVVIVLIWYTSYRLGASQEEQLYVVAGAAVLLVWGAYAVLWLGQKDNGIGRMLKRFAPRTHLGHTKSWLRFEKWLDAPENKVQGLNEDSNKDKFVNK
ncbi:MAG: undecaprenyl/decaprenyl-phosphate alpha-N-acetylglucosaminyl 1-phosphate transferase [Paludibacteraceae bacterium]|nr:undecaprenyl/decaprenyl-phosphate alpha-N-acetylglucosaminyl 1-phosphate transferase [Paludibacteraceae bacterium]